MTFRRLFYGLLVAAIAIFTFVFNANAQLSTQAVEYDIAGEPYEGYVARNEGFGDEQPLVLLVHDWNGLGTYEQKRAEMLATQGYTVFAVDLYGKELRPTNVAESQAASGKLFGDRPLMRERLFAGLEVAKQLEGINPERVAIMGYCFGGSASLELARAGADLDGFVSFHGGLALPEGQDYSKVTGEVLVLHGTADPVSGMDEVTALANDLTEAGVTFDMELYGNVRHAFTPWGAGDYDAQADTKSWHELLAFLDRLF